MSDIPPPQIYKEKKLPRWIWAVFIVVIIFWVIIIWTGALDPQEKPK
jgi:hypothetical protein